MLFKSEEFENGDSAFLRHGRKTFLTAERFENDDITTAMLYPCPGFPQTHMANALLKFFRLSGRILHAPENNMVPVWGLGSGLLGHLARMQMLRMQC